MSWICLALALICTVLLGYVSYVQLLYLESLRIIRRETRALEFFRETVSDRAGHSNEHGSLLFSVIKHIALPLVGVFYLCSTVRPGVAHWQSVLEAFLFSVLAMLLSTYLVPSLLYHRTTGKWLLKTMPLMKLLAICATPFASIVRAFQSLFDSESRHGNAAEPDSVENVEAFITAGAEEGILEEEDRKLIHSVVAFGDKSVREVMTPRPNITAIDCNRSVEDLRQLVINEQYSRIPVFQESIDNIIGFVHVRDIFELDDKARATTPLLNLIRPIRLVPETKPVTDLLKDMQHDGSHIAVVIDEYGSTAGLVTMEDLVEEILGEIRDEHEPERDVRQESESVFVAPGNLDVDRLEDLISFRPDEELQSSTLGGLVMEWMGRVPQPGEWVEKDGVRFEVLSANDRRVDEVRISRLPVHSEAAQ